MDREDDSKERQECWLSLTTPKQFSRLLYANPVCFLSTTSLSNVPPRNVMVLSWLTATNNEGRFMFSLNKRRHTALVLVEEGVEFCLSVPVQGMEDLITNVGGTSGRFGSKLEQDHAGKEAIAENDTDVQKVQEAAIGRRQKKKQPRLSKGVPGLKAISIGHVSNNKGQSDLNLFAIDGTVAHLQCKAYQIMTDPVIDEDHNLILARVEAAYVHTDYWNTAKNLFQPQNVDTPPYLTFLGSQTFGYVHSK
jgi:flavin reductase (DIM6/NTAB) family NADH-FMN oxidoreductase RutF